MIPLGQPIRLTFSTFSDAAETIPADPTTASLYVLDPTGVTTTYTWAGATVTRTSAGVFYKDYSPATAGHYIYRWVATGAVATSLSGVFDVDDAFPVMLVSLDDAKAHLNIESTDDDDELTAVIGQASALLLNHPDYRITDVVSTATYSQDYSGGGEALILDRYPATITSVTEYVGGVGTALASEPISAAAFTAYGYRLDSAAGILTRLSNGTPTSWLGPVRVAYTTGAGTVPPAIRSAVLDLIGHLWETQRGGGAIRPVVGQDFDTLDTAAPSYLLPYRVLEALTPYRRGPRVG